MAASLFRRLQKALLSRGLPACAFRFFTGFRCSRKGTGHVLLLGRARLRDTRLEISGKSCRVEFQDDVRLWDCKIRLTGENCRLIIGPNCGLREVNIVIEDMGSLVEIGTGTTMTGPVLVAQEGRAIRVGSDCMVSAGAALRTSDSHAIFDQASGARINGADDVVIGDHCWIGLGAHVFQGAKMAKGSILGAGSLLRHAETQADSIYVGRPARLVRRGVTWCRQRCNALAPLSHGQPKPASRKPCDAASAPKSQPLEVIPVEAGS